MSSLTVCLIRRERLKHRSQSKVWLGSSKLCSVADVADDADDNMMPDDMMLLGGSGASLPALWHWLLWLKLLRLKLKQWHFDIFDEGNALLLLFRFRVKLKLLHGKHLIG